MHQKQAPSNSFESLHYRRILISPILLLSRSSLVRHQTRIRHRNHPLLDHPAKNVPPRSTALRWPLHLLCSWLKISLGRGSLDFWIAIFSRSPESFKPKLSLGAAPSAQAKPTPRQTTDEAGHRSLLARSLRILNETTIRKQHTCERLSTNLGRTMR